MFLRLDRIRQVEVPVWLAFEEVEVRDPVSVRIPSWRIRAGTQWLVVGRRGALHALARLLAEAPWPWQEVGERIVVAPELEPPRAWWARLRRRRRQERLGARWLAIWGAELGDLERGERETLSTIGAALASDPLLLVLDRVVEFLRPELRFRVATTLAREVDERGMALVTLAEAPLDGWIAVEHRAVVRGGRWEHVDQLT